MVVNNKELLDAVASISDFVSDAKVPVYIMLDATRDGIMRICHSLQKQVVVSNIECTYYEDDFRGKACVNLSMFNDILSNMKSVGSIIIDSIDMNFKGNELTLVAEPKVCFNDVSGDDDIATSRVVGVKSMTIVCQDPDSNRAMSALSRADYDAIFDASGEYDRCNAAEFSKVLSMMDQEKSKTVYFSANNKIAFVNYTAYACTAVIGRDSESSFRTPFVLSSTIAKSIASYLNRIGDNEVLVRSLGAEKFYIWTEDGRKGMWVNMEGSMKIHLECFDNYMKADYSVLNALFTREVLVDIVKSALASSGAEKTDFVFGKDNSDNNALIIRCGKNASQTVNEFVTVCDVYSADTEIMGDNPKFSVSLKVIMDMLSNLTTQVVEIAVALDSSNSNSYRVRISDIDMAQYMNEIMSLEETGGDLHVAFEHSRMNSMFTMCNKK